MLSRNTDNSFNSLRNVFFLCYESCKSCIFFLVVPKNIISFHEVTLLLILVFKQLSFNEYIRVTQEDPCFITRNQMQQLQWQYLVNKFLTNISRTDLIIPLMVDCYTKVCLSVQCNTKQYNNEKLILLNNEIFIKELQ